MEGVGASAAVPVDVIVGICTCGRVHRSVPSVTLAGIVSVATMGGVVDGQIEGVGASAAVSVGVVVGVGA